MESSIFIPKEIKGKLTVHFLILSLQLTRGNHSPTPITIIAKSACLMYGGNTYTTLQPHFIPTTICFSTKVASSQDL